MEESKSRILSELKTALVIQRRGGDSLNVIYKHSHLLSAFVGNRISSQSSHIDLETCRELDGSIGGDGIGSHSVDS